jgi:hypothetical protein
MTRKSTQAEVSAALLEEIGTLRNRVVGLELELGDRESDNEHLQDIVSALKEAIDTSSGSYDEGYVNGVARGYDNGYADGKNDAQLHLTDEE